MRQAAKPGIAPFQEKTLFHFLGDDLIVFDMPTNGPNSQDRRDLARELEEEREKLAALQKKVRVMRSKAPHRILLADDSLDEQVLAKRALTKVLPAGSTVRVVNSGNEAIAYMIGEGKFSDRESYPFPTLVITDLNMEDGDGFDVLEFLGANPGWSVVPRIVLSSSDDVDDVRTAFFLGASAYHVKGAPDRLDHDMRLIFEYWATSHVPPVDEAGKLLTTKSAGRRGARYPQVEAGKAMKRPPPR